MCFVFDLIFGTAYIAAVDRYDIFYGGHKSDADVGSGRRRRFLN
jgi:hypothetical protein